MIPSKSKEGNNSGPLAQTCPGQYSLNKNDNSDYLTEGMISASRSIEPGQNPKNDKKVHLSIEDYLLDDDVKFDDDLGIFDNPSKMGTKVISTSPSTTLDPIIL